MVTGRPNWPPGWVSISRTYSAQLPGPQRGLAAPCAYCRTKRMLKYHPSDRGGNTDDVVHTLRQRELRSAGRPGETLRPTRRSSRFTTTPAQREQEATPCAQSLPWPTSFVNVDRTKIDDSLQSLPQTARSERTREAFAPGRPGAISAQGVERLPQPSRLVEDAGVSLRTFYRHFRSKHDLLFADYDAGLHWFRAVGMLDRDESIIDPVQGYLPFPCD